MKNRILRKFIVLTVLGLPAGQAAGAQWKAVSVSPTRSIYLDAEAPERRGERVQAWDWQKFASEQTARTWEGKFHSVKSLNSYDCAQRTTSPVLKVYFDSEGAEIKRLQLEGLQFPSVVEPDSLREKLLVLACKSPEKAASPPAADKKMQPDPTPPAAVAATSGTDGMRDAALHGQDKAQAQKVAMVADAPVRDDAREAPTRAMQTAVHTPAPRRRAASPTLNRARRGSSTYCADPNSGSGSVVHGALSTASRHALTPAHAWTYDGERGVERWGNLKPEYAACAQGRLQSPIDIYDGARLELEPIAFSYLPTSLRIVDNGHTVQVNIDPGRYLTLGGRRYDLQQMHFHKPAEERVGGRTYDMSAHLVHRNAEGKLAVVAVLFEIGHESPFLRRLWPYLPMERGVESVVPDVRLELEKLLPENRGYFTYMGSLTTPPCTEGVLWIVMKTPVNLSFEQVDLFARLYPMNARPVQAANGRLIKESM